MWGKALLAERVPFFRNFLLKKISPEKKRTFAFERKISGKKEPDRGFASRKICGSACVKKSIEPLRG